MPPKARVKAPNNARPKARAKAQVPAPMPRRKAEERAWRGWALAGLALLILAAGLVRATDPVVSSAYFAPWPQDGQPLPAGVRSLNFSGEDGNYLNAWVLPAQGEHPDKPALLYLHGNSGNLQEQLAQFSYLPQWGYDTLALDYRGFGNSQGSPSRKGVLADCRAAFRQLQQEFPGRRYGIVGFSMGGAYALMMAPWVPKDTRLVALAPFTSFRGIGVEDLQRMGWPGPLAEALGWLLVPQGLEPLASARQAGLPPILFVHGTADSAIPFGMGRQAYEAYGGPKAFLEMQGYNHGDYHRGPLASRYQAALEEQLR